MIESSNNVDPVLVVDPFQSSLIVDRLFACMQSKSFLFPTYNLLVTRRLVNILINSADTDEMSMFWSSLFAFKYLFTSIQNEKVK